MYTLRYAFLIPDIALLVQLVFENVKAAEYITGFSRYFPCNENYNKIFERDWLSVVPFEHLQ